MSAQGNATYRLPVLHSVTTDFLFHLIFLFRVTTDFLFHLIFLFLKSIEPPTFLPMSAFDIDGSCSVNVAQVVL